MSTDEPKIDSSTSAKISCGIAISTSTKRLEDLVDPAAQDRGEECRATPPSSEGQERGDERDADGVAGAVDQAGQHVAAELVGAEQ